MLGFVRHGVFKVTALAAGVPLRYTISRLVNNEDWEVAYKLDTWQEVRDKIVALNV